MADKKSAPLPASSGGLMRFFEDETKGFKIDPKVVISIPIGLIVVSWAIDLFLATWANHGIPRWRFKYSWQIFPYPS